METINKFFPKDFAPGTNDVLIGRGKKCYQHSGNVKFRNLVAFKLDDYSAAKTKQEKSRILAAVMAEIRENSDNGGFLKNDPATGLWFEVGDFLAREKTSQAFRDALEDNYRSSNSSKKKRRRLINAESKQKNDVIFPTNTFSVIKYGLSKCLNADQNNKTAFQSDMDCFEPEPIRYKQSSRSAEMDVNNFDVDDLELDDCSDLMSSCSSLCFEDDIDYDFKQEFNDESKLEPKPILEKAMGNTCGNAYGVKRKHTSSGSESNYKFGGFSSIPSCRTSAAMSA